MKNLIKKVAILTCALWFQTHAVANTVTLEQKLGAVDVPVNPERVVVMGPGALDALDYLGIKPVGVFGSFIPGYLSEYQDSKSYPTMGTFFEPDFEAIYGAKPDFIVIGPRLAKHYPELSKIAPTYMFTANLQKDYWQSTQKEWRELAKVFSQSDKVEQKIASINSQLEAIKQSQQTNQKRALTVMKYGDNISVFGPVSRMSSIYNEFGFAAADQNIDESMHGQQISYEFIAKVNPDVLFVLDGDELRTPGKSKNRESFNNTLVNETTAGKNNQVVFLNVNAWYNSIAGITAMDLMIEDIDSVQ